MTLVADGDIELGDFRGWIVAWPTNTAPTGFLLCDGTSYLRATYADLFAIIGTTYGAVDGTHFNVPDMKGKVIVGRNIADTEFDTLAETGGEKTHTLTTPEIPAHTHTVPFANGGGGATVIEDISSASAGASQVTSSTGGGGAHNNLQPYVVVNYIIKY